MTIKDNVMRVLNQLGMSGLVDITREEGDRVFAWPIGPGLRRRLRAEEWMRDPGVIAGQMHGDGSESYREPSGVHPALQVVFHPDPDFDKEKDGGPQYEFVEIDLDKSAPVDVVDGVGHAVEVLHNLLHKEKTDQQMIAMMLDRRFPGNG